MITLPVLVITWTDIVAIYAATLSTVIFVNDLLEKKKKLKIIVDEGISNRSGRNYIITVMNEGEKPITLASVRFILEDGYWVFMDPVLIGIDLSPKLEHGESKEIYISHKEIADELRSAGYKNKIALTAVAIDALGRKYKGKKKILDLNSV